MLEIKNAWSHVDYAPACVESSQEINYQDPTFKIGNIVRISKYKKVLAKGYVPNWLTKLLEIIG